MQAERRKVKSILGVVPSDRWGGVASSMRWHRTNYPADCRKTFSDESVRPPPDRRAAAGPSLAPHTTTMWHSLNNGRVMDKRLLLTLAFLAAACRDAVSPPPHGAPAFAVTAGSGITLDQQNGTFNDVMPWSNGGSHVGMGFNPQNPH